MADFKRLFRVPSYLFFLIAMSIGLFPGCGSEQKKTAGDNESSGSDSKTLTDSELCRSKLSAAIKRLSAQRMAETTNVERNVSGLNTWMASCGTAELSERRLDDEALERLGNNPKVKSLRYTDTDGYYVRDCLLLRRLSDSIVSAIDVDAGNEERETVRVVGLFQWLTRHVSLKTAQEGDLPLNLYDVLMLGKGTASHRAWLFAELLRQQQMDAVLVTTTESDSPAESEEPSLLDTSDALVAVLNDNGGWLFDCEVGLPVFASGQQDLLHPQPAAVKLLMEHPRWKSAKVSVVAQANTFAPRMSVLQEQLAAEDSAVLYEELNGSASDIRPLLQRVVDYTDGQWNISEIELWSFPEEMSVASHALSEGQQQDFELMMRFFDAPFERKIVNYESDDDSFVDEDAMTDEQRIQRVQQKMKEHFDRLILSTESTVEDKYGVPSKNLLKVRIEQISGVTRTSIIQRLQEVQITSLQQGVLIAVPKIYQKEQGAPPVIKLPLPEAILGVNQSSSGNSMYWTALCQLDRGELGSAVITLGHYRRLNPKGQWTYPSMINEAVAQLMRGRLKNAASVLKQADQEENPERKRVQLMLAVIDQPSED